MKWWQRCWRCGGSGVLAKRGERIPREQLTPSEVADEMVNGGGHYWREYRGCHRCGSTGLRKRYR